MPANPFIVMLQPFFTFVFAAVSAIAAGAAVYFGALVYLKSKGYSRRKLALVDLGLRALAGFVGLGLLYVLHARMEKDVHRPEFTQQLHQAAENRSHHQ